MLRVSTNFTVMEMVNAEYAASDFEIIDRTTDAYINFTCQAKMKNILLYSPP